MTSLIPQISITNTNKINQQKAGIQSTGKMPIKTEQTSDFELSNLPTSSILGQFLKIEKINKPETKTPVVWKNDLKSLFNQNKAVIWAMIPRTFNATDYDGDGLVESQEKRGTFLNAIKRLDKIKELGVNTLHVLPIHEPGKIDAMGISGSLYAPKNFLEIDPKLDDKKDPRSVKEEFKEFIDECHRRDIRVMLDLPSCGSCDMYNSNPELMAKERSGVEKTPQGWMDIRMLEPWHDETKKILNNHVLELHRKYVDMCIELGIDGIRADVARAKPSEFWDIIIPYSHSKDPNFAWLAETYTYEDASPQLNMQYDRPKDLLKSGFDAIYGQYHIFHEWTTAKEITDYVVENLNLSKELEPGKSVIASFATHDDISPMFHGGVDYCNMTTALQATLPMVNPYFVDGFHSGDYYLYKYENAPFKDKDDIDNKYDVHRGKLDIFNHSRKPGGDHPEIGKFMSSVMKMRKENEDVLTKGSFIPLEVAENPEDRILAFARHHNGKTLLTIVNRNVNNRETGAIKVPGLTAGTTLKNLIEPYGEESYFQVNKDSIISVNLGKSRVCVFEINTPNIEKSGVKVYKQKQ